MKITVSLPDELFESADALAARLGVSRSRLYSLAIAEYVAKHRDESITDRLNQVYSKDRGGTGKSLRSAQAKSVRSEEW